MSESKDTTVKQDKKHVKASLDNMLDAARDIEGGAFSAFVESFADVSGGEYENEDRIGAMLDALAPLVIVKGQDRFDFEANKGRYAWSAAEQTWKRVGESNDFVLKLPETPSGNADNVTFTVADYEDQRVTIGNELLGRDGKGTWLPTRLHAYLAVDGERAMGINLKDLNYTTNMALPLPSKVDLELLTAPLTHSIRWTRNTPTDFDLGFGLRNQDAKVFDLALNVQLADDDYANFEDGENLKQLSGTLTLGDGLRVEFEGALGQLAQLNDPSSAQINEALNAELFYQGQSIGTLEYREEGKDVTDEGVYLVYKDGSSENVARYYEDFLERLEAIFANYTGDFVDFN